MSTTKICIGIVITALSAIALAGCSKPDAESSSTTTESVVETTPPPQTSSPSPISAATPAPEPSASEIGYFLLVRKSIETDSGFHGINPGARLRLVAPGKYSIGGQTIDLRDDEVTNDAGIARQMAGADAARMTVLRQRSAADVAKARAMKAAADAEAATTAAGTAPTPNQTRPGSSLDRRAYNSDKGVSKGAQIRK